MIDSKMIEEAAEYWWYEPLRATMNRDGTFDKDMFRYKDLGKQSGINGFTAGAKWAEKECQKEIESLKQRLGEAVGALEFYDNAMRKNWAIDLSLLETTAQKALAKISAESDK